MKTVSTVVSLVFAALALVACTLERVSQVDPNCKYTQNSEAHVKPRHCDPSTYPGKSKFDTSSTVYCNGLAGGQKLCDTVQAAPDRRTVQPDGRICYDKDMDAAIGTRGERWARVIIEPGTGEVVTQFPEAGAGCRS